MIPSGVQIRRDFDVSVMVKHCYHLEENVLVELQWHVNKNKIAVDFLLIGFHQIVKRLRNRTIKTVSGLLQMY